MIADHRCVPHRHCNFMRSTKVYLQLAFTSAVAALNFDFRHDCPIYVLFNTFLNFFFLQDLITAR